MLSVCSSLFVDVTPSVTNGHAALTDSKQNGRLRDDVRDRRRYGPRARRTSAARRSGGVRIVPPLSRISVPVVQNKSSGVARNTRRSEDSDVMVALRDSQALKLIRKLGIVRVSELEAHGVPRVQLYRLVRDGLAERRARGVFTASTHAVTAEHTLAQVAKQVPGGVFCLLTALRFHGLTTQAPAEAWIALPEKACKPKVEHPRLRMARFSGAALTEGIETHRREGVEVRVYSAAKTVADCFKYRNKIGIDVAVEALRDFTRRHRGGATELARYAGICRVSRVMQPYLDAIA